MPIEVVIGTKGAAPCDGAFSGGREIGVRVWEGMPPHARVTSCGLRAGVRGAGALVVWGVGCWRCASASCGGADALGVECAHAATAGGSVVDGAGLEHAARA